MPPLLASNSARRYRVAVALSNDPISSNDPTIHSGRPGKCTNFASLPWRFDETFQRLTLPIGFAQIERYAAAILRRAMFVAFFLHSSVHEDYVYQGEG